MRWLIGVDEAGRGPLAGPVAVGMVAVPADMNVAAEFPGVADSKQLSEKKREQVFEILETRAAEGGARYRVEYASAADIDAHGIAVVIRACIARGLAKYMDLVRPYILLDGGLRAPSEYAQETIIGGDATVPLISLASVAAKVSRDRQMVALAREHPAYGFERHKGYGTAAHYAALRAHGLSPIHRRTFVHLDA